MTERTPPGLLLDVGGVCLKTPFELLGRAAERYGLEPGALAWTGPFDPAHDDLWRDVIAGRMSERGYWQSRAEVVGELAGESVTLRDLMTALFAGDEKDVVRPEAAQLARDTSAAGRRVGVLSNDLQAFHGKEWAAGLTLLHEVNAVVDASVDQVPPKPAAEAYLLAIERLGLVAPDVLFVDDQEPNVRGASAAGLCAVLFDVTHPTESFAEVRRLLGLDGRR
jgi:putative hydrolase of the HAD superfamily